LNYFNIFSILLKTAVTLGSQGLKISVMYTAAKAGFNYSLAINLYSLTPFLTAVAFYILFKERLNALHLVGMALLFVCIVITSQAGGSHHKAASPLDPSE
jgi:drug/metabolite transporter (DMT)-like permease